MGDLLLLEEWQPLSETPRHVRRLDAHRYDDAREAARFARTGLEEILAGLRPLAWGVPLLAVYGSALRMIEDHDTAQQALVIALERAELKRDQGTLGDLLQRLAYAVADRCGDYRRAGQLAARATDFHLLASDLNAVGKTLVDRGLWLRRLDCFEEAIGMQHRALALLRTDEHRNRFTALQGLGIYHLELGDPERAQEYATHAAELAPRVGSWLAAKLFRLRARIAVARQRYSEAEEFLGEATEVFSPISAGEAALATAELVRVQLLQDRADQAQVTANTMVQFIIPLEEKSPVAAKAALDLFNCGQAGGLIDLELVTRVTGVLEKERTRPSERARSMR